MAGAADVGLYTGSLLALLVLVSAVLRHGFGMGLLISALLAVGLAATGVLIAVALQVALAVPLLWSIVAMPLIVLLFVLMFGLAT